MTGLFTAAGFFEHNAQALARIERETGASFEPIIPPGPDEERLDEAALVRIEIGYFSGEVRETGLARRFLGALRNAPNLGWLHLANAGTDAPVFGELYRAGARLSNSSGTAAVPIAQSAIAGLLMLARGFPRWGELQRRHEWEENDPARAPRDLHDQRLLVLGLGAGWQENEHAAYDIPFYTVGERLRRLDEAAQIIRSLFANDLTTFEGRYYTIKDAPLAPKPVQRPGPPLLIGGGGEKVTLRIAAQWADEWNVWGDPEILQHKGDILARHCADVGRDPSEIKHSANAMLTMSDDPERLERARSAPGFPGIVGTVDEVKAIVQQYADAGVDELIIPNFNMGSHARERYDEFIEQVAPEFR